MNSQEDEIISSHLHVIRNFAGDFGFENLFDMMLVEVKLSPLMFVHL